MNQTLKVFCEYLGMRLVTRQPGVGDILEISFVEEPATGHRIEFYRKETDFGRMDHIAFQVRDVDESFKELCAKEGLRPEREPYLIEQFNAKAAFVTDANGFRIQLVEFLSPARDL